MNIARIASMPTAPTKPAVKVAPAPVAPTKPVGGDVRVQADPAYQQAIAKWQAWVDAEKKLPLQKGSETRLYLHPEKPAKGTLVMYHGYTAGTWQFEILARQAYDQGYNVVIPRLPGHGLKDKAGKEDPSQLRDAKNWQDYEQFGDETYAMAKGLGGPISTLGLSVGGNIAMSVAERHPVGKVVAYAPFLKPVGAGGTIADVVHVLDKVTFGLAGRALALIPWSWGKECEAQTASGQRPGHSKFSLGTLYGAAEFGRKVTANAGKITAPIEYFTTGSDDAADEETIRKAFQAEGGDDGWYFYPKAEGIPHPMVHPMEDKGKGQTPELYRMTMQFLNSGKPINRAG
jgi:alpha-beta hydrolase superfamily lysophospholipase